MTIIITTVIAGAAGMAVGYAYRSDKSRHAESNRIRSAERREKLRKAGKGATIRNNDWLRESET